MASTTGPSRFSQALSLAFTLLLPVAFAACIQADTLAAPTAHSTPPAFAASNARPQPSLPPSLADEPPEKAANPHGASAPAVHKIRWVGCLTAWILLPSQASEMQKELPPGFVAQQTFPGIGTFEAHVSSCKSAQLFAGESGRELARVEPAVFAEYSMRVEPPDALRNPRATQHTLGWTISPNPKVGEVLALWGLGGPGNVTFERRPVAAGIQTAAIVAEFRSMIFEWTAKAYAPVALPEMPTSDVYRNFGSWKQELHGAADLSWVSVPGNTYTVYEFKIRNGTGFFAQRPEGATIGGIKLVATEEVVWSVAPLPKGPR